MNVDALIKKHSGLLKTPNGPKCQVGSSKHRELIEALVARGLARSAVARIIKAEGIPVTYQSIQRHSRKGCSCA